MKRIRFEIETVQHHGRVDWIWMCNKCGTEVRSSDAQTSVANVGAFIVHHLEYGCETSHRLLDGRAA